MKKEIKYHLSFWVAYVVVWGARDMIFYPDFLHNVVINLVLSSTAVPLIYFNILFLVPKMLFKRRVIAYIFVLTGCVLVSGGLRFGATIVFFNILDIALPSNLAGINGGVISVSETLILFVITMSVFLVREWYVKERYTRELEQKNTQSELSMLRHQLQPHFLFNNLNTIYFLMESNPGLAREVMINLSDLLSHQLYDARKDLVPLKNEFDSIESYLKIQQVRHADFLRLEYQLPAVDEELKIAPMILITFIENAFKHGQKEEGYFIEIVAELAGHDLSLRVINTVGQAVEGPGGIGLENVKRRLSLIYPNKHHLEIANDGKTYEVSLHMNLSTVE